MKLPELKIPLIKIPIWISLPVRVCGYVIGVYLVVETWVISKATTVVEPVKKEVELIKGFDQIHQERVERELRMLRSVQDDMNKYLREN